MKERCTQVKHNGVFQIGHRNGLGIEIFRPLSLRQYGVYRWKTIYRLLGIWDSQFPVTRTYVYSLTKVSK